MQEAREHFKRGGLPGAVRPQEPDEFALLNKETDVLDGPHIPVLPFKEAFEGAGEPRLLMGDLKRFGEMTDFDHKFNSLSAPAAKSFRARRSPTASGSRKGPRSRSRMTFPPSGAATRPVMSRLEEADSANTASGGW